jgi:hypothetical protein
MGSTIQWNVLLILKIGQLSYINCICQSYIIKLSFTKRLNNQFFLVQCLLSEYLDSLISL